MISDLNSSKTLIGRLQIKGDVSDPTLARLRAASLFNSADLSAAQVTPSAIVFIRKIRDPMPGTLSLDQQGSTQLPAQWNHALAASVRQLTSKAVRPALSRTTGNEDAVIFLDGAELLASLATDLCEGVVSRRWWWQYLWKTGDTAEVVKRAWRESPEYIPGAVVQLSKTHKAVEFVRLLSDDEAHQLTQLVGRKFGLHVLLPVINRSVEETRLVREEFEVAAASELLFAEVRVTEPKLAPWHRWITKNESRQLSPEQERFLGISLATHSEPARARSRSFAREVESWAEYLSVVTPASDFHTGAPSPLQQVPVTFDQVVEPVVDVRDVVTDIPVASTSHKPERQRVKIGNAVFTHEEPDAIPQTVINKPIDQASAVDDEPIVHSSPEPEPQTPESSSEAFDVLTIQTDLGGLFYLINLAIFLELYNDFTSPAECITRDLSIWDFVGMVGADINGEREFDDPIWTRLQDLTENPEHPVKPAWLIEQLPDIHTRLRQALGINEEIDLAGILLHHHARVIITATHLDVFFSLSDHPIEIRLSGLDRNPGWVPAAGRFIAFHYD